jgi:hypothetical protein
MKICVVMSDDRALTTDKENSNYHSLCAYVNYSYCKRQGYDFKYFHIQPHVKDPNNPKETRHPSWAKILAVYETLCLGCYDAVMYVDSDCGFLNHTKRVEDFIAKYPDNEIIFFNNQPHNYMPCGGAFVCKSSQYVKEFLQTWFNYKNPEHEVWIQTLEKEGIQGSWALGQHWEQDTLWVIFRTYEPNIVVDRDEYMFTDQPAQMLRHYCHSSGNSFRCSIFRDFTSAIEKAYGPYDEIIKTIKPSKLSNRWSDVSV